MKEISRLEARILACEISNSTILKDTRDIKELMIDLSGKMEDLLVRAETQPARIDSMINFMSPNRKENDTPNIHPALRYKNNIDETWAIVARRSTNRAKTQGISTDNTVLGGRPALPNQKSPSHGTWNCSGASHGNQRSVKGTSDLTLETTKNGHPNRYEALRQAIPAYQRISEIEYHRLEVPNLRPKPRKMAIRGDLTMDQIENVKRGFTSKTLSPMITLHFEGMKRNRTMEIKSVFRSIGIKTLWIRNIGFIGKSVMELLTFQNKKDEVVRVLEKYEIHLIENFDPLSLGNLKNEAKYAGLTVEEKKGLAEKLYKSRIEKTVERLPKTGIHNRLRNYLWSKIHPRSGTNQRPLETVGPLGDKPTVSTIGMAGAELVYLDFPETLEVDMTDGEGERSEDEHSSTNDLEQLESNKHPLSSCEDSDNSQGGQIDGTRGRLSKQQRFEQDGESTDSSTSKC
jgi:hypothetical protein